MCGKVTSLPLWWHVRFQYWEYLLLCGNQENQTLSGSARCIGREVTSSVYWKCFLIKDSLHFLLFEN